MPRRQPSSRYAPIHGIRSSICRWLFGIMLAAVDSPSGATSDVAIDAAGRLWAADGSTHTIRVIDRAGAEVMSIGAIGTPVSDLQCFGDAKTAYCGDGEQGDARFGSALALAFDPTTGNVYVADAYDATGSIRTVTPSGTVSTYAGMSGLGGSVDGIGPGARFSAPAAIAADRSGNVYVCDELDAVIRRIAPDGVVTTLAGVPEHPGWVDGKGSAARFNSPHGIAVDAQGTVYVADTGNHVIRRISPSGIVSTLAGSAGEPGQADGIGQGARFSAPNDVVVADHGNVYVADTGNNAIRRIGPAGDVHTLVAQPPAPGSGSIALRSPEHVFLFGRTLYAVSDDQIVEVAELP